MEYRSSTTATASSSPITLGEKLGCLEVADFILTETSHKPNQKLSRHHHENANIAIVLSGTFKEVLDGRSFDCVSNSVIVKPAGEAHANEYGRNGMRCLLVEVLPRRFQSSNQFSKTFDGVRHVQKPILSILATRIFNEMRVMDDASLLALEGLSLELSAELSRHSNRDLERRLPYWLKSAREILHEHSFEALTVARIAAEVGVHPVHLSREFRRFYGCTLGEYLRGLRIEVSCRKLSDSDSPLAEIALDAGFSHQAHFSRVFKRHIGLTPNEFRSLHRSR